MLFRIIFNVIILIILIINLIKILKSEKIINKLKIIIIGFILIWIVFFCTDYILVKNQKLPLFCIPSILQYQDGGTIEYIGYGYKVIDFHRWVEDKEIMENPKGYGIKVDYKYLCPLTTSYSEAVEKLKEIKKSELIEYFKNK